MKQGIVVRIGRWSLRLLVLILLSGVLFYTACVARPQAFEETLAPEAPVEFPAGVDRQLLRVVVFNVWGLPLFSDEFDDRMEKIPAEIAALEPDIVCLQEVWTDGSREKISKALGPSYATARCDGGGLMILTRFPILSEAFTPFPFDCALSFAEWMGKKGVMEAVLETPQGRLRVVNTHLALDFGEDNGRTRQLDFLLELLEDRRDLPLVIGADLNTPPCRSGETELRPEYLRILEQGFVDLNPPVRVGETWDPGPASRVGWPRTTGRPGWRPDHILYRESAASRLIGGDFRMLLDGPQSALSDHNLLLGEIELRMP
jgi:endonuclease/exonuclease/phosphatase family metal-dependent hydrolase